MLPSCSSRLVSLFPPRPLFLSRSSVLGPSRHSGPAIPASILPRPLSYASRNIERPPPYFGRAILYASLLVGGTYFAYRFLKSELTVDWPPEVKGNAKAALWCERKGDKGRSLRYWEEAFKASCSVDDFEKLGKHPYLVISGIGVMLVEAYIEAKETEKAKEVLSVLSDPAVILGVNADSLDEHDIVRQICVLDRLANLQDEAGENDLADSSYDQALNLAARFRSNDGRPSVCFPKTPQTLLRSIFSDPKELEVDAGVLFANAGSFWSRQGGVEYIRKCFGAFQVAVNTLVPDSEASIVAAPDKACFAATVATETSAFLLRIIEEPKELPRISHYHELAKLHAELALMLTEAVREVKVCGQCYIAAAFAHMCLSKFYEGTDSPREALEHLRKSEGLLEEVMVLLARTGREREALELELKSLSPPTIIEDKE